MIWPIETHPFAYPPGAEPERQHSRSVEREVDHREEQIAQAHRVTLGLRRDRDVVLALPHPTICKTEGLDRTRALHRLGQGGVDPRIGGALGDVTLRRALQVGPYGEPARRDHHDGGRGQEPRVQHHRHDTERDRQQRDHQRRQSPLHRAAHRADIAGDAGDEVAGAGTLDLTQRQAQHRAYDVFPRGRQQILAEERRGALTQEAEERLGADDADDDEREGVHRRGLARDRLVDQSAEQVRYDQ